MAGGTTGAGRSVTSKVTAILMAFSRGDAYSLTELARLTGLPVSTAHRLAGELAARRLLERTEDGGYRIGLPLRMIGAGGTPAGPSVSPAATALLAGAAAVMGDLATATRLAVRFGTVDGRGVVEALVRAGEPVPQTLTGSTRPIDADALGQVLLAFGPRGAGDAGRDGEPVPDPLRRTLNAIRLTRMAVVSGAVAMPVFGAGGRMLAAVEVQVVDLPAGLYGARAALAVATGSLSRQWATTSAPHATAV